jgi:hypothetical protein
MNKLRNTKVTVNGETFDSKREYDRWCELRILERAGFITELKRQVEYELIPKQVEVYERYGKNGKRLKDGVRVLEREVKYIADFEYIRNGKKVVEDAKGYRDPSSSAYAKFVIKRKMMLWLKGIRVIEV